MRRSAWVHLDKADVPVSCGIVLAADGQMTMHIDVRAGNPGPWGAEVKLPQVWVEAMQAVIQEWVKCNSSSA